MINQVYTLNRGRIFKSDEGELGRVRVRIRIRELCRMDKNFVFL